MRRTLRLAVPAILIVGALAFWGFRHWRGGDGEAYRFVEVTRGDVKSVVSSTGALQAITTVEVGTQVSGKVAAIFVDFNDRVTAGQLIARIDPTLLEQAVRSAEVDLERNTAELEQARRDLERIERLYQRQVSTESEYTTAQYKHAVAEASVKAARINLERARQNLSYTEIVSPINGIVLDRTVDEGQTVAASLSAPQLFLIAEDLSAMEILAAVDESDIGKIREGQPVEFTVQAYPDESFQGTVDQVRMQSATQENVVNYTVVVSVANPDGRLLPGMTATVDFIVAQATDVLRVPNAALRFRPSEAMRASLREQRAQRPSGEGRAGGGAGETDAGLPGSRGMSGVTPGAREANRTLLWHLDTDGKVTASMVRTGITDGQSTEIEGPAVQAGMRIIASIAAASASGAASANPFQNQQGQRPPGPPPGM